jgi:hypothetical protein
MATPKVPVPSASAQENRTGYTGTLIDSLISTVDESLRDRRLRASAFEKARELTGVSEQAAAIMATLIRCDDAADAT